ncbi:conjugal transfer protein TraR [Shewanella sp. Actino-trap-3]|jgi:DnaK suppressor protein|uniref:TraR/DksA family transcriptional regulator n=1 Tax=Shewanella TaxID=22 RepID=UPI000C33CFAC|nr:TraR/DksA C4-type zinc finger protein [Shewanella sp. Actino-trap-3]PKG79400.1 conjugal transfer protein TraR [Shewanella sp. Actino-trap-3]|tara:strand:- start:9537 stop:9875 length:339 start_codon:yes stop_codon:yes gene_type:complete
MDETQIKHFKQQLLQLRSELMSLSSTSDDAAKAVELDQSAVGRLSRMDAMRAQSMAIEAKVRREHQILSIEGALRRIAADDFGFCLTCGEEINIRRLEVDPSYSLCIKCADK